MLKRLVMGTALGMLVLACCLICGEASAQDVTARPAPSVSGTPPTANVNRVDPSVGRQMQAIEHHAKVRMILYPGRFGQGDLATAKNRLEVVAVSRSSAPKLFQAGSSEGSSSFTHRSITPIAGPAPVRRAPPRPVGK